MTSFPLFPGDLHSGSRPGAMKTTLFSVLLLWTITSSQAARRYFGAEIGNFSNFAHDVKGQVFAVDDDTILVRGFHYDGTAPDAYFWAGNGNRPSPNGVEIPYPGNSKSPLKRFNGEDVILHLPQGMKVSTIDHLSVWCRAFTADFGHVVIPQGLEVPRPQTILGFATRRNGVRSVSVTIEDDRTVVVPSFSYDGRGEDAFFIAGKGNSPSMTGDFVKLSDESGGMTPLREYRSENIKLKFPPNRSVTEFNWISVYSKGLDENLGHISLPRSLVVPPALEEMNQTTTGSSQGDADLLTKFTNCVEPFDGTMQVRWKMDKDGQHAIIQMMGKIRNAAGTSSEYMAFGLSPLSNSPRMVGADVVVGFYDSTGDKLRVEDYYMSGKSQCDGSRGVCSDTRLQGANDAVYLDGEVRDGVTIITYKRPLAAGDSQYDLPIPVENDVTVIAAIGQLSTDDEPRYHGNKRTAERTLKVNFARENQNTCGSPLLNMEGGAGGHSHDHGQHGGPHEHDQPKKGSTKAWKPNVIFGIDEFQAKIGPTGGEKGYSAITGRSSWGIAWWINGMLIPEIYVERGKTYKFIVEGGDSDNPAESHPFYITDNPDGGFGQKQQFERARERVFAGVRSVGNGVDVEPTSRGRLCKYMETTNRPAEEFDTFDDYKKTLKVDCQPGNPGQLIWTVQSDTPDEVYYQCFTHKNMGWKIHVKNAGFVLERQGYGSGAHGFSSTGSWLMGIAATLAAMLLRYF